MPIDQRWVWGGIAVGGAGVAIYMYRRDQKLKKSTAQATATAGYGYGFGYGYGGAYSYGMGYEPYGYGFGPLGLGAYGGSGMYGYGYYGAGTTTVPVPQTATTNAQWSEAAMSALTSAGYDPMTTLAALGQYLLGGNLTAAQVPIVTAAIGAEGYPPVEGPNGFPPQMKTGGTPGGGQPPPGKAAGAITGLQITNQTRSGFTVRWNPAQGATQGYAVIIKQMNGKQVGGSRHTTGTTMAITGLHPGWTYNVGIQALPGGQGNNIHATTSK